MKIPKQTILKTILSLMIVTVIMVMIPKEVKAASFWEDVFGSGDDFLETGKDQATGSTSASDGDVAELITILYNVLSTLGVIVVVAVGGILGIKFMSASAEDKAKIKESMIPYIAGSIVIFGAFTIWNIAIKIFSNIS